MESFSFLEHRKNIFGTVGLWLCVLVVALALPLALRAQDTGYISGTVTDKSGAAVVGAEVVLTNVGGSLTRTTTTNADGLYVIAGLPGATYNLVITAKGFQKFSANRIVLNVAEKSRVDVQLTVGAVTEVVEVTGEAAAQVETSSSDLSSTITGKQVENLVLNGRNFTQLVTLAPGVVNQTGQDEGTVGVYGNVAYSMNGGRTEYNNWELDGGDNMDNGSNATLNVYPNPEAISAATAPAPSKSKPRAGPSASTAAPSNICATICSMPDRGMSPGAPTRLTRNMISAIPLAAPFTSPITTMPTRGKRFSSSPRNGAARKTRPPSFKTFRRMPNAAWWEGSKRDSRILQTYVLGLTGGQIVPIPVQTRSQIRQPFQLALLARRYSRLSRGPIPV
ncbi:MAG: hypothetical protein AUH86_18680 [Acidobacteria bacterium 13_1_40CM_4_58_4]|nr:MAG: hypothetical protein AUH86_18680 [Acidobacteria bacterium 13_1_40CM_4_58_4]